MNDWIFVDQNIRREVLFNIENYEFEFKDFDKYWNKAEIKSVDDLIRRIKRKVFKYRYRLKQLEPIRISEQELIALSNYYFDKDMTKEDFEKAYNRTLEIID